MLPRALSPVPVLLAFAVSASAQSAADARWIAQCRDPAAPGLVGWLACLDTAGAECGGVMIDVMSHEVETDAAAAGPIARVCFREHQLQFPRDIQVFYVAPPALDEIHRWLRDQQERERRQQQEQWAEAAAKQEEEKQILRLFSGVRTPDDLKKLDDIQFFVAFYRGLTRLRPEMRQLLESAEVQILGHVMEGKDTAHVVSRLTVSTKGTKISKMDILSMKKMDSGWGMLLNTEIEGFANLLKQRFGTEKK